MLDIPNIENCLQFLNRVDLKGAEVPAFVDLTNRLHHLRSARIQEQQVAAAKVQEKAERKARPPAAPPAKPKTAPKA